MVDVWTNSVACHPRATCHYNFAMTFILNNTNNNNNNNNNVQSLGEINVMIVPHCRV